MPTYNQDIIKASHKHSSQHKDEILQSNNCSCFYCLTTFSSASIVEWTDKGQTALCPHCGIDSVIGDKSGYPITDIDFLKQMNSFWF